MKHPAHVPKTLQSTLEEKLKLETSIRYIDTKTSKQHCSWSSKGIPYKLSFITVTASKFMTKWKII